MVKIVLCTIAINESDFAVRNIAQHADWPGRLAHIWVEGADVLYPLANDAGLSIDGMSTVLQNSPCIEYRPIGWFEHDIPNQSKCFARQIYVDASHKYEPDWIAVIDADEFYDEQSQHLISKYLESIPPQINAVRVPQTHLWKPPGYKGLPLRVRGQYWDGGHVRFFRYKRGMTYLPETTPPNHNWPTYPDGLSAIVHRLSYFLPDCFHFGFAPRNIEYYIADLKYYIARGERQTHPAIIRCREALLDWNEQINDRRFWKSRGINACVERMTKPLPSCMKDWFLT